MDIHAYSGFVANDNLVKSRTAGVLAALLETYPSMSWDDVLQWANAVSYTHLTLPTSDLV